MTDRNKVLQCYINCCLFKIFNIAGLFCQVNSGHFILSQFIKKTINEGMTKVFSCAAPFGFKW